MERCEESGWERGEGERKGERRGLDRVAETGGKV